MRTTLRERIVKISPAGVHMIAGFEGFRPTPYNDVAGNATIGYGHLLHVGPVTEADRAKWRGVEPAALLNLLALDAEFYASRVDALVRVSLGLLPSHRQARFDALTSFAYNVGVTAFANSLVLARVNAKGAPRDWTLPANAMLQYDHVGGVVVLGLLARRRRESSILVSGTY